MSRGFHKEMAEATGLTKEAITQIAEEVKANLRALDNCTRHAFEEVDSADPLRHWDKRYRCRNCGGTISQRDHKWYQQGARDARES